MSAAKAPVGEPTEISDADRPWHRVTIDREHTIAAVLYQPAKCSCGNSWGETSSAITHAYAANAVIQSERDAALRSAREREQKVRQLVLSSASWDQGLVSAVLKALAHSTTEEPTE